MPNFWLMFKNTVKIGISAHQKAKKHFEGLLSGPSRGYYLVQVGCVLKTQTWTR